jgi:hypothetical protein
MENNAVLIVFAKAPVPGEVKTRLAPALDAETAALLHAALVERALVIAQKSGIEQIELCCAPDSTHTFFETCAEDFDIALTEQGEGNLGQRMLRALQRGIEEHGRAIIIGADCPALTGKHIDEAARALQQHDAVLTPAEDGGYVLIGASGTADSMFDDIDWGSGTVLASQRRNFAALNFRVHEMPTLWDVDRPEDLLRLKALKPPLEFFWP